MQPVTQSKIRFQSSAIPLGVAGVLFLAYAEVCLQLRGLASRSHAETFLLLGIGLVFLGASKLKGMLEWGRWLCLLVAVGFLLAAVYVSVAPLLN